MINYKLLTPGPLTTTDTVKQVMMDDHCTWDDDYKQITQKIRKQLLNLAHVSEEEYTTVLMQGSPGVTHSSKAKVSTQKLKKIVLHSGSRSFCELTYHASWFNGIIASR